jgi:hypothetical protein
MSPFDAAGAKAGAAPATQSPAKAATVRQP